MADEKKPGRLSTAASRVGRYYSANTGAVLKGVAVVGAIGIGAYAVYKIVGTLSPNCTTPGSACYSALSGYTTQLNDCSTLFAQYSNQFVSADAAAGTGLTAAQEQELSYYQTCMNDSAASIASTSAGYNQDPISTLAFYASAGIVIAATAWGLSKIIPTLNITGLARSGTAAASALYNSTVRALVNAGVIPADSAAALAANVQSDAATYASNDAAFWNSLSALNVISVDEATSAVAEETDAFGQDFTDTVDILSGLVGSPAFAPSQALRPAPLFAPFQAQPVCCY